MSKTIIVFACLVATSRGSDSSSWHVNSFSTNSETDSNGNEGRSPSPYQRSPWSPSTSTGSGKPLNGSPHSAFTSTVSGKPPNGSPHSASTSTVSGKRPNGSPHSESTSTVSGKRPNGSPHSASTKSESDGNTAGRSPSFPLSGTPLEATSARNCENKPISSQAALGIFGQYLPDWSSIPVNPIRMPRRQEKESDQRLNKWEPSSSPPDKDDEAHSPALETNGLCKFTKLNTNHPKRAAEQLLRSLNVGHRLLNEVFSVKMRLDRHPDEICEASQNQKQICSEAKEVNTLPNMEVQFMTNEGFYKAFECHSVEVRIACDIFVGMDVLSCPENYLVATGPEPGCFFYFARNNKNSGKKDVKVLGQACHDGSSIYESYSEGGESVSNDIPETSSPMRAYTPPEGNEDLRTKDGFRIPPLPKTALAVTSSKAQQSATSKLNVDETNVKGKEKIAYEADSSSLETSKSKFKSPKDEGMPSDDSTRKGPKILLPKNQLPIDSPHVKNKSGSKKNQIESSKDNDFPSDDSTRKGPRIRLPQNQLPIVLPHAKNKSGLKIHQIESSKNEEMSSDDSTRKGSKIRLPQNQLPIDSRDKKNNSGSEKNQIESSSKDEEMPTSNDSTSKGPKIRLPQNKLPIDFSRTKNKSGSEKNQIETSSKDEEMPGSDLTRKGLEVRLPPNQIQSREIKNKSGLRDEINSYNDIKRTSRKVRLPKVLKSSSESDHGTELRNADQALSVDKIDSTGDMKRKGPKTQAAPKIAKSSSQDDVGIELKNPKRVKYVTKKRAIEEGDESISKILKGKSLQNKKNAGQEKFSSPDYGHLFNHIPTEVLFSEETRENPSKSNDEIPEAELPTANVPDENNPKKGHPKKDVSSGKSDKNISRDPENILDSKEAASEYTGSSSRVRKATNDSKEVKLKRGRAKTNLPEKKKEPEKGDLKKIVPKSKSSKSRGSVVRAAAPKKTPVKKNEGNPATHPVGIISNTPDGNSVNLTRVLKPKKSNNKKKKAPPKKSDTPEDSSHSINNSESSDASNSRKIKKPGDPGSFSNKNDPEKLISHPDIRKNQNEPPLISDEPIQMDIDFLDGTYPHWNEPPVQSESVNPTKSKGKSVRVSKPSEAKPKKGGPKFSKSEKISNSDSDGDTFEQPDSLKIDPSFRIKHVNIKQLVAKEPMRKKSERPKRAPKSYAENYISPI